MKCMTMNQAMRRSPVFLLLSLSFPSSLADYLQPRLFLSVTRCKAKRVQSKTTTASSTGVLEKCHTIYTGYPTNEQKQCQHTASNMATALTGVGHLLPIMYALQTNVQQLLLSLSIQLAVLLCLSLFSLSLSLSLLLSASVSLAPSSSRHLPLSLCLNSMPLSFSITLLRFKRAGVQAHGLNLTS